MNIETPYRRPDRVAQQILHIIGEIATRNIDLSFLGFITFTKVELTSDLKLAKVYYSVIQPKYELDKVSERVNGYAPAFRKYLGAELRIKFTPQLTFIHDDALVYAEKMNRLFADLDTQEDEDGDDS